MTKVYKNAKVFYSSSTANCKDVFPKIEDVYMSAVTPGSDAYSNTAADIDVFTA